MEPFTAPGIPAQARTRLQHRLVATRACAEIQRRGRHLTSARNLSTAAEQLQDELDAITPPRHHRCGCCGCTDQRPCERGCHWVPTEDGTDLCSRCATGADHAC